MSKIKEFVMKNKLLVTSIIAIILLLLILIIALISNSKNPEKTKNETSLITSATNEIDDETDKIGTSSATTSVLDDTKPKDETTDEEITQDTSMQEEATTDKVVAAPIPSEYPYIIKINRIANCVTVYGKDINGECTIPVKAITVSCGKIIDDTPLGEYHTVEWYNWGVMFDGSYGRYAYRIVDSILFHSVPYYAGVGNALDWVEYNKLGTSASHGCVRMSVIDAKWLVENCAIGTKVIIYDDASNPGPLGKPLTIKIPADSPYRDWDPTDPNPNNPWHQFPVTLNYPESKVITVNQGSNDSNLRTYFTAKDTCGNDISSIVTFSGEYDLNVAGTYNNVIASVTDATGKMAKIDVTIIVKARVVPTTTAKPIETITEKQTTTKDELTTEVTVETETSTQMQTTSETESNSEVNTETSSKVNIETETTGESGSSSNQSTGEMPTSEEETTSPM